MQSEIPDKIPENFEFLTVEEAQGICRAMGVEISLWTIRRLVRQGKMKKFGGGRFKPYGRASEWRILIPRASVLGWLRDIQWDGSLYRYKRRRKRKTAIF